MRLRFFIFNLALIVCALAQAWNYDFGTLTDITEYQDKYAPKPTPSAIGDDGTIYQTGLYDDMVVIGDYILENVATSAYIAAIDPTTQIPKWAVGLRGAAHITQILVDGTDIYVSGTFADEVILGSMDMEEKTIAGTTLSHDHVNTFVAKYSSEGNLVEVLPILPVLKDPDTYEDKDLSVIPTALAMRGGNLYLSFTYKGGYKVDTHTINGTVQSSQGKTTCLCLGVLSIPTDNLKGAVKVLDVRGSSMTCNAGHGPWSVCLTTTANSVEIATFISGQCTFDFAGWTGTDKKTYKYNYSQTSDEIGMVFVRLTDEGHKEYQSGAGEAEWALSFGRDKVRNMMVSGNELYISGNLATEFPMKKDLKSLLFTDQFAACLNLETYEVKWATTTGARNEDFPNVDDRYRETIGGALSNGNYIIIGTTDFYCGMGGAKTDFDAQAAVGSDYDVCLGVSATSSTLAVTTRSEKGSQLSVGESMPSRVDAMETDVEAVPQAIFSVDGVQRAAQQKGAISIIKYSDGSVKKQVGK